jgi:hypothetical protein
MAMGSGAEPQHAESPSAGSPAAARWMPNPEAVGVWRMLEEAVSCSSMDGQPAYACELDLTGKPFIHPLALSLLRFRPVQKAPMIHVS